MSASAIQKPEHKAKTVQDLLTANMGEIGKLVPKHVTPDRLLKVMVACIVKTPGLQGCTAASLVNAFKVAAELGLEPGGALGHMYLVPYGEVCTPIIGYRGLIDLARRSGQLRRLEAHVVYANEPFTVIFGLEPRLKHSPMVTGDRGGAVAVYAVAHLKDGSTQTEVMRLDEVIAIRDRSKASKNGPWVTDFTEMARKTVVRRICKYLPLSPELGRAFEVDDENDVVDGQLVTHSAITAGTEAVQSVTEGAKAAVKRKLQLPDAPPAEEVAAAEATQAAVEQRTDDIPA